MSYKTDVPRHDYIAGFVPGFLAIKGEDARLPVLPGPPRIGTLGLTQFLVGIRDGLEHAGIELGIHP
jgi:hypothetical protein